MTLNEMIDQLIRIRDECNWGAHPFGKDLEMELWDEDINKHTTFKITSIEPHSAACGCWIGAVLNGVAKKDE